MSRYKHALISLFVIQLFLTTNSFCQCPEKIVITTDRDLYFSGENLWYKVECLITGTDEPSPLSKVVYLELTNISGMPVTQLKLYIEKGQSSSMIILPDTLSTGNYFLTGYTNWMKNYNNQVFTRRMISVINPFRNDVFTSLATLKIPLSAENDKVLNNTTFFEKIQKEYKTRSLVDIIIKNIPGFKNISVSVARKELLSLPGITSHNLPEKPGGEKNTLSGFKNPPDFLPEPEGKIISGTIKKRSDNKPLAKEVVILNFVDRTTSLYLSRTDNKGRFWFSVNQFGNKEMVIQPIWADTSGTGYSVELDPSFVADRGRNNPIGITFNDSLINEINKCIINMQVEALYNSVLKRSFNAAPVKRNLNFYNDPEIKKQLDKYIELPTLSEVFKEIVPSVSVKDWKNNNAFRVFSSNGLYLDYFAIVDGVQIKDIDRVLSMNPEDVKQIELIDLKYHFKDQELGAIISIQTKKGDLSALNFDNRIFRQEYNGYEFSYSFSSPDYSVDSIYSSPVADFRNVLYWNPDLKTGKDVSTIRFYTSDDTGIYLVSIEGIGPDGKKIRIESQIKVVN
jgi:hypothetical protein